MSTIFSIHLWRDDRHEDYCGCWHVPVSEDDPVVATLSASGFGCFRNEDGTIGRAFFLADELAEQMDKAERVTECFAEATVCKRAAPPVQGRGAEVSELKLVRDRLTEVANDHQRVAERYAAELLDKLGIPHTYDEAVTVIAVAYLEGEIAQLKVARDSVRGGGS